MIPGQRSKPSRLAGSRLNAIPKEQSQEVQPGKPIEDHRPWYTHISGGSCISTVKHLSFCMGVHMGGVLPPPGNASVQWACADMTTFHSSGLCPAAQLRCLLDTRRWSHCDLHCEMVHNSYFFPKILVCKNSNYSIKHIGIRKGLVFSLLNVKAQVNLNSHYDLRTNMALVGIERKPRVWPSHTWAVLTLAELSLFPRTLSWKNSLMQTSGSGTRLTSGLQIYVMKNGGPERSFSHW